ncbi:MAG: hypothetical protein HY459_01650 [Parcubacteria group bacterium]|nr:hypothetical protein [Parcubacteria group bacterium]
MWERTLSYVVGAFGLVAGLAWNEAIRALIDHLVPLQKDSIPIKFLYALVMTVVLVIVTAYLVRLFNRTNDDGSQK